MAFNSKKIIIKMLDIKEISESEIMAAPKKIIAHAEYIGCLIILKMP